MLLLQDGLRKRQTTTQKKSQPIAQVKYSAHAYSSSQQTCICTQRMSKNNFSLMRPFPGMLIAK